MRARLEAENVSVVGKTSFGRTGREPLRYMRGKEQAAGRESSNSTGK